MLGAVKPPRLLRPFRLAILLCAIAGLDGIATAQTWYNFQPTELAIYSADGSHIVGHSHYEISATQGGAEIRGEARYLDGESDVERDRIEFNTSDELPRLARFSHIFFLANGEMRMQTEADIKLGIGTCNRYEDHGTGLVTEQIAFPPDIYAGVTTLIPLEYALRNNQSTGIKFHAFSCAPKPRVFELSASVDATRDPRTLHEGNLVKIRVRPDFGWLTVLAMPFLPRFYEWFDPSQGFRYMGGTTERYYKGPTVELVRQGLQPEYRKPPMVSAVPSEPRAQ
jgi:hypothetical protein